MRVAVLRRGLVLFFVMVSWAAVYIQAVEACTWDSAANKCQPATGEVVVYKHSSCNGPDYFSFMANNQLEYADLNKFDYISGSGSLNDSISCFVIGPKTVFRYYDYANYGGKSVTISNNNEAKTIQKKLGREWWNDKISSVKVFVNE